MKLYEYAGESKSLNDWSKDARCAVHAAQFKQRVKAGWGFARALTTPLKGKTTTAKPVEGWPFKGEAK